MFPSNGRSLHQECHIMSSTLVLQNIRLEWRLLTVTKHPSLLHCVKRFIVQARVQSWPIHHHPLQHLHRKKERKNLVLNIFPLDLLFFVRSKLVKFLSSSNSFYFLKTYLGGCLAPFSQTVGYLMIALGRWSRPGKWSEPMQKGFHKLKKGKSAASFCRQVAAWFPHMFCNF